MPESYLEFRSTQQSFSSSDGRIDYMDQGEGDVILLLHGVPTSSWLYRKIIPIIASAGYRVIAPDMLGFGNSGNPKGYEIYDQDHHAKRLLELMDSLHVREWTHVMHDGGGLWTWALLKKAPKRITKLIVLNTILFKEGFHPPIRMEKGLFARFSMWLYRNNITTNLLLNHLFKDGMKNLCLTKEGMSGYKKPLLEGKTHALYFFFTQTCNNMPDYSAVIENVGVPVAVIWGEHDEMLRWEPQKEKVIQALKLKPENTHLIDAKHFIQEEMPEEIAKLILGFLIKEKRQ